MWQINQSMFTGEIGIAAQVLVAVALAIHVRSSATKMYELERNRRAICYIFNLFKYSANKFIEANTHIHEPSTRQKIFIKWLEAFVYCLFSAYFWVFSVALLAFFVVSESKGFNTSLLVLFIFTLMIVANMYHVAAQKVRVEIERLNA